MGDKPYRPKPLAPPNPKLPKYRFEHEAPQGITRRTVEGPRLSQTSRSPRLLYQGRDPAAAGLR